METEKDPAAEERGRLVEVRFFEVAQKTELIAPWIHSIRPATPHQDACGVDAIATVKRYVGDLVRVPIQIKSTAGDVELHLLRHKEHWLTRMVFVVVNEDMRASGIRDQLRRYLHHVRTHRYDFNEFFYEVDSGAARQCAVRIAGAEHLSPFLPPAGRGERMSFS